MQLTSDSFSDEAGIDTTEGGDSLTFQPIRERRDRVPVTVVIGVVLHQQPRHLRTHRISRCLTAGTFVFQKTTVRRCALIADRLNLLCEHDQIIISTTILQ